jgi:hypothetical protein
MAAASNQQKSNADKSKGNRSSSTSPLPFEPQANKKTKAPKLAPNPAKAQSKTAKSGTAKGSDKNKGANASNANRRNTIPEVVSKRMVQRMAFFCGIPTLLGFSVLPGSYLVITNHWFELPNTAVLLVSLGFLGLSVLGLSYGVLSASWDEDQPGSLLGFREFGLNWDRFVTSWKNRRQP